MRTVRLAACAAVVAAASLAPAALAGPACNLVVDPKGDARVGDAPPGVYVSPDQDILGGDVASNKKYVTAVVRLASLRELDTDAPTGRVYVVEFSVGTRRFSMTATYGADGYQGSVADVDKGVGIGAAAVVIDHANKQVRLTASTFTFALTKGRTVSNIVVSAGHRYGTNAGRSAGAAGYSAYVGGGGANSTVDTARGSRDYVAGSASCVAVGR